MKSESETRWSHGQWSARVEAVKPIHNQLEHVVEQLENIADQNENSDTRSDGGQL